VLSFALSMVWLKLSADTLVHICMVLGTLFGVPPPILGATVLAWGNSMPDLANNLSLARDGFPTMAITACFASPLFTLLVGTSTAMAYGAVKAGGVLEVPFDRILGTMYGEGWPPGVWGGWGCGGAPLRGRVAAGCVCCAQDGGRRSAVLWGAGRLGALGRELVGVVSAVLPAGAGAVPSA
jgi:hypothetical protein